jgi:integrase/recombinase XerD
MRKPHWSTTYVPPARLKLEQWPEIDHARWAAALVPSDPFRRGGVAAKWALNTQRHVEHCYGRWLFWLHAAGDLDPLLLPGARVTDDRLNGYLKHLQATKAPFSVQNEIQAVGMALQALEPTQDWKHIGRAAGRLRTRAVPVRDKRSSLRAPTEIMELGQRLMQEADSFGPTLDAAMLYRDGFVIMLLAHRPILRARNLGMIRCDEHLVHRNGQWQLLFAAHETKTKKPIELSLSAEVAQYLERYLIVYRPILLTAGGQQPPAPIAALWVSRDATPLCGSTLAHHIKRHTRAAFGAHINPHWFRDCTATDVAINHPEQIGLVPPLLGHTDMKTSEQHYNLAGTLEAGRRYHADIASRRDNYKHSRSAKSRRANKDPN